MNKPSFNFWSISLSHFCQSFKQYGRVVVLSEIRQIQIFSDYKIHFAKNYWQITQIYKIEGKTSTEILHGQIKYDCGKNPQQFVFIDFKTALYTF